MKKPPLDPNLERLEYRTGVAGLPGWGGVNTEDDIEGMADNDIVHARNIRWRGGNLITVSPRSVLTTIQSGYAIRRMVGYTLATPVRLWSSNFGCPDLGSPTGSQVNHLDTEESPNYQAYAAYSSTTDTAAVIGKYQGRLYIGLGPTLRRSNPILVPLGTSRSSLAPGSDVIIANFTGLTITFLKELDGKLFIGLSNDAAPTTTSKIVVYNGLSLVDDITGIQAPVVAAIWREKLAVGFSDRLRLRSLGDPPGTYAAAIVAGGSAPADFATLRGNTMVSWKDRLYGVNGTDKIWQLDDAGTTITNVRTVAGAGVSSSIPGTIAIDKFNDQLYYLWNNAAGTLCALGKYNASGDATTEWIDSHKAITSQLSNMIKARMIKAYRDRIFVGGFRNTIIQSPGKDIPGTWLGTNPASTTFNLDVRELEVV